MEVYSAFERVAVAMLLITLFFYNYKNWLPLRKNSIYKRILFIAVVLIFIDLVLVECSIQFVANKEMFSEIASVCMSIGFPVLYFYFLLYDLATAKQMRFVHTTTFKFLVGLGLAVTVISVAGLLCDSNVVFLTNGKYVIGMSNVLQIFYLPFCPLLGIVFIIRNRTEIAKKELWVIVSTNLLLCIGIAVQFLLLSRNYGSYYTITLVLLSYYLLLHNSDQYSVWASGCFSGAGFNMVLSEKAHYRENFSCLGICISNIESITNYCTEQEIIQLHRRIGKMLHYYCGKRNTYNIHSFEYVAVLKSNESVKKRHRELAPNMPQYIRINNKNIPLLCDFYMVEFADAGYDIANFNRILVSMRKLASSSFDRNKLLNYQGDKQVEIQNDLEAMRVVNTCIARRRFDYKIMPIQSLNDLSKMSHEMIVCKTLDNGNVVSQERLWEIANDTGHNKEMGYIICEMLCDYIQKEKVFERNIERVHVNISPNQILSKKVAERYVKILSERNIPGERVCFEITIDQDVDYDRIAESFLVLKEYGIQLLLDQFGVCVCSLKKVLNMPFDSVKLNHYMIFTYCYSGSRQLEYLINMLKVKGWRIYLDGVDRPEQIEIVKGLEVSDIQGQALSFDPFHKMLREHSRMAGGNSDEC